MSAVGLLLLEDPKARARAEARIRNGQGNRRSFFGRSGGGKGRKPDLPPPLPEVDEDSPVIVRPNTSMSISVPGIKKSAPSERSSSRNSIFGRKNSISEMSIKSGTSDNSGASGAASMQSAATQTSEADRYDKGKQIKTSGRLAAVQEKDTPATLSDVPEYVRPVIPASRIIQEEGLSGAESDAGSVQSRSISPISNNPPSLPPAARISRFDETMFNEMRETSVDPSNDAERIQALPPAPKNPKRISSLPTQKEPTGRSQPVPPLPVDTPPELSPPVEETKLPEPSEKLQAATSRNASVGPVVPKKSEQRASWIHPDLAYRSAQSLPPVPAQLPGRKKSDWSIASLDESSSDSSAAAEQRTEQTLSPKKIEQLRHSGSTGRSPAVSFSGGVRESTIFADSSWEDDIDFVYELGAEAACDFDWDFDHEPRAPSIRSNESSRKLRSKRPGKTGSIVSDVSRRDSRTLSGVSTTYSDRRHTQKSVEGVRGYAVGHRGFAAARNTGDDFPANGSLSPTHSSMSRPSKEETSSPVLNIYPADDGTPSMVHIPNLAQAERFSDNLSDPESWRNSSKHRKSSSYGSLESFARTSTTTTSARDTNRWSVASGSSMPSLVHSRPKRTASLSKTAISAPLEMVPQHPEDEKAFEVEDGAYTPDTATSPNPEDEGFVLRRPRTSGERRLLQAAGRQRHRPSTATGHRGATTTNGVDWI